MSLSNSSHFSKNMDSNIYSVFPELNQGSQYLQKQAVVKKKINNARRFIESFSIPDAENWWKKHTRNHKLKKCTNLGQGSPSEHLPCACGNSKCTASTPYCNMYLGDGTCFSKPADQKKAEEDWDVNSNCVGDGQFSSCKAKAGCANYGYCPPTPNILEWQKDTPDGAPSTLQAYIAQQQETQADYMANLKQYVKYPPPCNGNLTDCPATSPYYGRNVTIPQRSGPAPYGPGYPHPNCGLEVMGSAGKGPSPGSPDYYTFIRNLDDSCHAQRTAGCIGIGGKTDGSWDYLKWNANPAYSGATDKQMKTPNDYKNFFYIQNPVDGCNTSVCCGIKGRPDNCKYDEFDPACFVPPSAAQIE